MLCATSCFSVGCEYSIKLARVLFQKAVNMNADSAATAEIDETSFASEILGFVRTQPCGSPGASYGPHPPHRLRCAVWWKRHAP